jgi:coenzyme F420-reducing hydrogenase alpha subunit
MSSATSARRGSRSIQVDVLARVEGEGALDVRIEKGEVTEVRFRVYEPPRFFEAFLRGRSFAEVPDITSRICGICPIAYQTSAVNAIERAFGVTVDGPLSDLRRLIYCGEWIESHALHVYLLHGPDFLGYESGIHMARDHGDVVARGLRLKKAGNTLVSVLGGREIHPINVKVGGFWRAPARRELTALLDELAWARDAAVETVRWVSTFEFPDFERDYAFVALRDPERYPLQDGRIVSSLGHDLDASEYESFFTEEHVQRSNALHSTLRERGPYHVGPLARYSLNFDRLSPLARECARAAGLGESCRNPFRSIIVRSVETVEALEEALRIIRGYEEPPASSVPVEPREGTGWGVSEAPRGMLYHRYRLDAQGLVRDSKITPPTSQNQKVIEQDLLRYAEAHVSADDAALTWGCEQTVRNYDPCISCATHVLKVNLTRE